MIVEFEEVTPDEWRIVAAGRIVGSIGQDTILDWHGFLAEWRHFCLEFDSLEAAKAFVTADLQGEP